MSRSAPSPSRVRANVPARATPVLAEAARERLINAAGEVFAEMGFRAATVRDICTRAGVNIAAVNYYFGDKAGLYTEVLRYTHAVARERYPLERAPEESSEESLRRFVRTFMMKILDQGRPAWHGKLMAREMVEPTTALDEIVSSTIRPTWNHLTRVVGELLSQGPEAPMVRDCAASVMGQCLLFCHCRPVIERLFPARGYSHEQIMRLSEHIANFSLASIRDLRARCTRRKDPPRVGLRGPRQGRPDARAKNAKAGGA